MLDFTDSKNRRWVPKVTALTVRNYERRAGVGIFAAVFDSLDHVLEGEDDGKYTMKAITQLCKSLFGSTDNVIYFLYECCVDPKDREEVTEEDFYSSIGRPQIHRALMCAITAMYEFLPEAEEWQKTKAEGKGDSAERVPTSGKTSLPSLDSLGSSLGATP